MILQNKTDVIVGRQIQFFFRYRSPDHLFAIQPGHDFVHEPFQYFVSPVNRQFIHQIQILNIHYMTCRYTVEQTNYPYLILNSGLVLCSCTSHIGQNRFVSKYLTMQDRQTVVDKNKYPR